MLGLGGAVLEPDAGLQEAGAARDTGRYSGPIRAVQGQAGLDMGPGTAGGNSHQDLDFDCLPQEIIKTRPPSEG